MDEENESSESTIDDNLIDDRSMRFIIEIDYNQELQDLIRNRNNFENQLYDFLISSIYPDNNDSFWEPVKVILNVDQLDSLKEVYIENHNCPICMENLFYFNNLDCCNQVLCTDCSFKWFGYESVYCPFCKCDIREKI